MIRCITQLANRPQSPRRYRMESWLKENSSSSRASGGFARGSIGEQTRLTMDYLKLVIETVGATMEDVVSSRVFLHDITNEKLAEMNEAYGKFFGESKPARMTVGCQSLNIDVEIARMVRMCVWPGSAVTCLHASFPLRRV